MKKTVSILVTFFIAVLSFAQPAVGQKAKEISLPDVKGKNIVLSSLKGKIVLIDFWASWCGPCRKSNPELKNTYAKYQSKGLEIYGISVDNESADWKQAIKDDRTTWIHVNDAKGDVAALWNARSAGVFAKLSGPTRYRLTNRRVRAALKGRHSG